MNPTTHSTPPANARTGGSDPAAKSPTVRDERRIGRIIAIFLAVLVLAVLAFNILAPRDRLRAPDEAAATAEQQRQQPTTTAPGDGTLQRSTPAAGDSPTPPGREGMGAPAGAAPSVQPPTQDVR